MKKELPNILLNPQALNSLYESIPSFDDVSLLSIKLMRDGPTCLIVVETKDLPNRMRSRWPVGATRTAIGFQAIAIVDMKINGWRSEMLGALQFHATSDDDVELSFVERKGDCSVWIKSGFLRVDFVRAYESTESNC